MSQSKSRWEGETCIRKWTGQKLRRVEAKKTILWETRKILRYLSNMTAGGPCYSERSEHMSPLLPFNMFNWSTKKTRNAAVSDHQRRMTFPVKTEGWRIPFLPAAKPSGPRTVRSCFCFCSCCGGSSLKVIYLLYSILSSQIHFRVGPSTQLYQFPSTWLWFYEFSSGWDPAPHDWVVTRPDIWHNNEIFQTTLLLTIISSPPQVIEQSLFLFLPQSTNAVSLSPSFSIS